LDDRGCNGAPDMVVEILSPSTMKHDLLYKLNKYLQAGVREYWIIDPEEKTLHINILEGNQYILTEYNADAAVEVSVLPGCKIDLKTIFA
jgi:Uma2 family endonuclease